VDLPEAQVGPRRLQRDVRVVGGRLEAAVERHGVAQHRAAHRLEAGDLGEVFGRDVVEHPVDRVDRAAEVRLRPEPEPLAAVPLRRETDRPDGEDHERDAQRHGAGHDRRAMPARPEREPVEQRGTARDDGLVGEEAAEVVRHVPRRRVPRLRVLRESLEDDRLQRRRHRGVHATRWDGVPHRDVADHVGRPLAGERGAERQGLVERRAERPDVGPVVEPRAPPQRLLGAHVARRPEERSGRGQGRRAAAGREPEVGHEEVPPRVDHQVRGLHVAVDHPVVVRVVERLGGLEAEPGDGTAVRRGGRGPLRREGARLGRRGPARGIGGTELGDHLGERAPVHELHRVVVDAALRADAVDRDDVRVVEQRRRLRLVPEALELAVVEDRGERQDLQRHAPAERDLLRLVDDPHAAAADLAEQPEVAERATGALVAPVREALRRAVHAVERRERRAEPLRDLRMRREERLPRGGETPSLVGDVLVEQLADPGPVVRRSV
jgi:hypothetical protein